MAADQRAQLKRSILKLGVRGADAEPVIACPVPEVIALNEQLASPQALMAKRLIISRLDSSARSVLCEQAMVSAQHMVRDFLVETCNIADEKLLLAATAVFEEEMMEIAIDWVLEPLPTWGMLRKSRRALALAVTF